MMISLESEWVQTNLIVFILLSAIFSILYLRRKGQPLTVTSEQVDKSIDRLVPYREALVTEDFFKSLRAKRPQGILWITRNYLPDVFDAQALMAHDINLFLWKSGWKIVIVTPWAPTTSYEGIPILQFYQKTEIGVAIQNSRVIITQGAVLESAIKTAERSRTPLVILAHETTNWANYRLPENTAIVKVYNHIPTPEKIPTILLNQPVNWRKFVTHSTREYITFIGPSSFYRIAGAFPEYKFLEVSGIHKGNILENVTKMAYTKDIRDILAISDIIVIASSGWARFAICAGASGIPIIVAPTESLKEILGQAPLYGETDEEIIRHIRALKTNPLFYKGQSELVRKRAMDLNPLKQLEEFNSFLGLLE